MKKSETGIRVARTAPELSKRFASLACAAAAAAGLFILGHAGTAAGAPSASSQRHVLGRVLVQPRTGLSPAELDKIIKPYGGRRTTVMQKINVHFIELPPQANAPAVAAALSRNRNLKFAEVDALVESEFFPTDPYYSNAWHLPKIGAPSAWDYTQGNGVTIAILDSGVDISHPDLQSQIVPGWNFYNNNNNVTDLYGHGTAVAGTAAAAGNNGTGVASVSFNSKIMPMRVTDDQGYGYYSLIAQAIIAAADSGARVANVSFLGISASSTVDSAAQYMRSKGGVVVTSGGNTGSLRNDPVRSSITAVAATDTSDSQASFSSWGDYIDVSAPGVSIVTTMRGGSYGGFGGTSAASPVVAGVYGLMMSANPGLAPGTLDNILFESALDLGSSGWDQHYGAGRVQADMAVAKARGGSPADFQAPTVAISSPTGGTTITGLVPVDVSATDNVGVTKVELYVNNVLKGTDTIAPYGFTLNTADYSDGQLSLQARAYDAANNSATSTPVTVAVANDNILPIVSITNPADGSTVSGTVPISVAAADNQGVAKITLMIDGQEVAVSYSSSLSYSWGATPTSGGKGGGKGGGWKKKSASASTSTITAHAEDAAGNSASATVTVTKQ